MYKILIADNQLEWLRFSQGVLENHGYDVVLAQTIEKLEGLLIENDYDLVLINADLMFGEMESTIRKLFVRNADKPIIVVSIPSSAHRTVQETRAAFKMGARDCVDKPFSSQQLLALIRRLLDEFSGVHMGSQGVLP